MTLFVVPGSPVLYWSSVANLFFAGLLAGEEVTVRVGIRAPLRALDARPHIELRQALIRTLRVLVPSIFALALASGIAATIAGWGGSPSAAPRVAGVIALMLFIAVTLFATVPINQAVLTWSPGAPPADWQIVIDRWERLDTVRTALALIAFALFLSAAG